ncbi:MAG: hypothetical protein J5855_10650, partial [Mailhella sp.]|nr:hypothetical protein [Mailhella sp.]
DRRWGKTVNFGFLYGQGARGLQHSLNEKYGIVLSIEQCKALQARFRKSYPILDAWGSSVRAAANTVDTARTAFPRTGVHTATGRWVPIIPFGRSGYTCPVNYTVQGTGADIMLLVLGKLPKLLVGLDAVIVNCVHDEVLVEASEADAEKAAEALAEAMTEAFTAVFPTADARNLVDVHIADAWAEAK